MTHLWKTSRASNPRPFVAEKSYNVFGRRKTTAQRPFSVCFVCVQSLLMSDWENLCTSQILTLKSTDTNSFEHVYLYTYIHIYIYTHMHIYIYMCRCWYVLCTDFGMRYVQTLVGVGCRIVFCHVQI